MWYQASRLRTLFIALLCLSMILISGNLTKALETNSVDVETQAEEYAHDFIRKSLSQHSPLEVEYYDKIADNTLRTMLIERAKQIKLRRELAGYTRIDANMGITTLDSTKTGDNYTFYLESHESVDFLPIHKGASCTLHYIVEIRLNQDSDWEVTSAYANEGVFYQFIGAENLGEWKTAFLGTTTVDQAANVLEAIIRTTTSEQVTQQAKIFEARVRQLFRTDFRDPLAYKSDRSVIIVASNDRPPNIRSLSRVHEIY